MAKENVDYSKNFFIEMNVQNPPKPEFMWWYPRKADESSIPEYTVEDWEFTMEPKEDTIKDENGICYRCEGASPKLNFRKAFLPNEDHYWVSRDFSGQEIRILANLAMEPTWIKTILEGGDIHRATAEAVWGPENYNGKKRKQAKAINFGLVYGQGPQGVSDAIGCTVEEAEKYIEIYFEKLPNIKRFLEKCIRDATQNKVISNPYGRKRRVRNHINSWGKLSGRGQRISQNFPIQSMGAEVIKIAIIKIYETIVKPNLYGDKYQFMNTIHDEVNNSVHKSIVKEVAFKLGQAMEQKIPGKPVPIVTDLEIGNSMGLLWKFDQDPETLELTPVFEQMEAS